MKIIKSFICLLTYTEKNLPSIDFNTCWRLISTIESAHRPNLDSFKQKFGKIITTHKNYGDVLHRLPAKLLPTINPPQLLADRSVDFFTTYHPRLSSLHIFFILFTVTEDQVAKIIMNSPSKSYYHNPWPTFIVLDYLDILTTPITSIINASLEKSKCPNLFNRADVTPIVKKIILRGKSFQNLQAPF